MTIEELYGWVMDNDIEDLKLYVDNYGFITGINEDNLDVYVEGIVIL